MSQTVGSPPAAKKEWGGRKNKRVDPRLLDEIRRLLEVGCSGTKIHELLGGTWSPRPSYPTVIAYVNRVHAIWMHETSTDIRYGRGRILGSLNQAMQMAAGQKDSKGITAAAREMAKICGHYAPLQIQVPGGISTELALTSGEARGALQRAFAELAGGGPLELTTAPASGPAPNGANGSNGHAK